MSSRSIGFIGGGRVTRILLSGLERAGKSPDNCVVSDTDTNVLDASILGSGFNPVAFAAGVGSDVKKELLDWLGALGECPEVPDEQLEAYAILTAMGPTYFWYQIEELEKLGTSFGLDEETARHALAQMLHGGVKTFFDSGMRPDEVIDLIPVKPLESSEKDVREAYRTRLRGLYDKLTQH